TKLQHCDTLPATGRGCRSGTGLECSFAFPLVSEEDTRGRRGIGARFGGRCPLGPRRHGWIASCGTVREPVHTGLAAAGGVAAVQPPGESHERWVVARRTRSPPAGRARGEWVGWKHRQALAPPRRRGSSAGASGRPLAWREELPRRLRLHTRRRDPE